MDFSMKRPCAKCPFRKGGVLRLTEERIIEIGSMFNGGADNATFACHETLDYDGDEDGPRHTPKTRHCAGAFIFAEKHEAPTQMMRIAERFNSDGKGYDRTRLEGEDEVWDDIEEWLEGGSIERRRTG